MGTEIELINLAELNRKMSAIATAIRGCTDGSVDKLGLNGIIDELADLTGYDGAKLQNALQSESRDEKLTAMADIIRYGAALTKQLSLDEMALAIAQMSNAVVSNGKALYDTLDIAIAECDDGGTVTLLKDIDVGSLCNVSISKDLTIDGNGHSIKRSYAGENLFVIQESVTFNVCHLNVEFNSIAKNWFIHSVDVSSNVNITDCILKSERGVIFLDYSSGSLTVKNSTIQGSASLYLLGGSPEVYIQNSSVCGDNGQALYLSGTGASVTISDSSISANNTTLGAIDVRNCSPTIDLKGTTKILIDENTHASIRMRGSANCDPIITLYDDVKLTEGVRSHIYYTAYGKRMGFHVKFADGYQGAKYRVMSTTDSTRNCKIWLENSLDAAYSHLSGMVDVFAFDENVANEAKKRGFTVEFDDALGCYAIL